MVGAGVVGVVGSGSMAAGIAQLFAEAGSQVLVHPADEATLQQARRMIARKVEKGLLDAAAGEAAARALHGAPQLAGMGACTLVVETQLADKDRTQAAIAALEQVLPPEAVIALNTSAHPVSVLAGAAQRPQRIAGLHFFEPAPLMRVVEVIAGLRTAPSLLEDLYEVVRRLGHRPVAVCDSPGFVANHVGRALLTEGARIVAEGVASPEVVDRIARESLALRMGPFELLDLIGLDVSLPVMEQLYADFRQEPRLRPPAFLALRRAAGLLGRKNGGGFHAVPAAVAGAEQGAAPAQGEQLALQAPPVWIDGRDEERAQAVRAHLQGRAVLDEGRCANERSLCLVAPLGQDASRCAAERGLDPRRTLAVDAASGLAPLATLMAPPGFAPEMRHAAQALFGACGPTAWIEDSPGFVAQRLLAALVNLGCEVAQQRVAAPEDIDLVVRLALGYPKGPLAWGDAFGPGRIVSILHALQADGDPRDRPSPWLRRRAELGLSLATP